MDRRIGKSWYVVLVVLLMALAIGCPKKPVHVTNLPPGVTETQVQNWYTAVGVVNTISRDSLAVSNALIQLNRQGVFPDGNAYAAALAAMGRIDRAGMETDTMLRKAPQNFTAAQKDLVLQFAKTASIELQNLQTQLALGIRDPNAQKTVTTVMTTLQLSISIAEQLSQAGQ